MWLLIPCLYPSALSLFCLFGTLLFGFIRFIRIGCSRWSWRRRYAQRAPLRTGGRQFAVDVFGTGGRCCSDARRRGQIRPRTVGARLLGPHRCQTPLQGVEECFSVFETSLRSKRKKMRIMDQVQWTEQERHTDSTWARAYFKRGSIDCRIEDRMIHFALGSGKSSYSTNKCKVSSQIFHIFANKNRQIWLLVTKTPVTSLERLQFHVQVSTDCSIT